MQGASLKLLGKEISQEIRDRVSPRRSAAGGRSGSTCGHFNIAPHRLVARQYGELGRISAEDWQNLEMRRDYCPTGFTAPSTQVQLGFLPSTIVHTDFIFAAIGEQLGFAGTVTLVAAFGALLLTGLSGSMEPERHLSCIGSRITQGTQLPSGYRFRYCE